MRGPLVGLCLLLGVLGQAFEGPEQGGAMGELQKTSRSRSAKNRRLATTPTALLILSRLEARPLEIPIQYLWSRNAHSVLPSPTRWQQDPGIFDASIFQCGLRV